MSMTQMIARPTTTKSGGPLPAVWTKTGRKTEVRSAGFRLEKIRQETLSRWLERVLVPAVPTYDIAEKSLGFSEAVMTLTVRVPLGGDAAQQYATAGVKADPEDHAIGRFYVLRREIHPLLAAARAAGMTAYMDQEDGAVRIYQRQV